MGSQRAHIVIPDDFLARIDAEVGPRKRSAYIFELAQAEYRRRKLLTLLEGKEPVMRDELSHDGAAVRRSAIGVA